MKKLCIAFVLVWLLAVPLLALGQNSWEIVRADYGSGNNWMNVTDRVRSLVEGDSLNFTVDGTTLGAVARRGRNRVLRLQLKDANGQSRQINYRDQQQVNLQISSNDQANLRVTHATYGSGNRVMDVTSRLNSQVRGDELNIPVNNGSMGGDPAPGQAKSLSVQYTLNGRDEQRTIREGGTLRVGARSAAYGDHQNNSLEITRATYGSGYRSADVTSRLNSQVQGDQLNIQVNSNSMGGDPAPGRSKTLTVDYVLNGRSDRAVVSEGGTLRLPYNNTARNNALQITRAIYGSGYRTSDVTDRVNSQVQGDQLNMTVDSATLGVDPAPGQAKTLTVDYTLNGRSNQQVTNEGSTLRLPATYGNNTGLERRLVCESGPSNNYGRKYCSVNTQGGVRLSRTMGNYACTEGTSWGYDNGGVWVDKGCSAEFETQNNGRRTGAMNSTTIPSGTELSVRTNENIDSKTATVGQTFSAVVAADVIDANGAVRIPKGADAQLVIRNAEGGGMTSASNLVLDVDSLIVSGTKYMISTGDVERKGGSGVGANQRTAVMVGGGAAVGTLIGAILGGGKGAAIGAAVGGGAGLGAEVLTKGAQVKVPAETILNFRLDQDLLLQASR
jgi:hypothetical protein